MINYRHTKIGDLLEGNNIEPLYAYCDITTGEIKGYIYEGDKIVSNEKLDNKMKYLRKYDIKFGKSEAFVKLWKISINELRKRLTPSEVVFAVMLMDYISYNDNLLRYNGHGNGKILTAKDIAELNEIDERTVKRNITSLVKKGVLAYYVTGTFEDEKIKIKSIAYNPHIACRGDKVECGVLAAFIDTGWDKLLLEKH